MKDTRIELISEADSMTRPTIPMAPAVKPEDLGKEYSFGLDAESMQSCDLNAAKEK